MNFGKLREVFVHNMPRKKNLLHFLHRCHGLREMSKIPARTKVLQGRLAKTQKRKKTPDPLQILAKASLAEHGTWLGTPSPNFKKFGENFVICEFFVPFTSFSRVMSASRARMFWRTARNFENLAFLERACKEKNYQYLGEAWFWDLSLQKLKIHQKNDFLPTFWVAESDLGRNGFWGGKTTPNSEIPLGMESRQTKLSNEPSCTWFGPVEPTQKLQKRGAAVRARGRGNESQLCQNWPFLVKKHCFDYGWPFLLVDDG